MIQMQLDLFLLMTLLVVVTNVKALLLKVKKLYKVNNKNKCHKEN